ncbi:MAG: aspartyl-tRNA(Asn)/glutamyl-tRNA(Gln) amidotransferase subunit [Chloroflexota bacterium]|nr:aspartyl-tRNA(Asn)/glutamyl-tRNA(Gln) amidotransferase subunit [Chloroflexota bacterium]
MAKEKTNYIADIGLEVHVELATNSKMFCSCAVVDPTTTAPNTSVCPVCCGMPGVLPVINRNAVELAIKAGLALNCTIAETSIFARKNYFYPDLPKGYQISQYEYPLAVKGYLLINTSEGEKKIRVTRAHLEEDTGKLTHVGENGETYSLVDLNRAGVPLLEIVSEPDMHTVEEVKAYSTELRRILRWLGISSGDMEKGSMRFEANLSMRPEGCQELGIRVEVKNLNSFRAMEQAILYQMDVQRETLAGGGKVAQQTLGWNEAEGKTVIQRSKEDANDYRYFPEPDLPPLVVDSAWLESIKEGMPELPRDKRAHFAKDLGLNQEDVDRLVEERSVCQFYEDCLAAAPQLSPKLIVNWMMTDLFGWLNQHGKSLDSVEPQAFVALLELVDKGTINQSTGKEVLAEMLSGGKSAQEIIDAKGLHQISDSSLITDLVQGVLEANPKEVQAYLGGKETLANWMFGQVMREAKGKANPQVVKVELQRQLDALKS